MKKLPSSYVKKPSKLIDLGVDDVAKCEIDGKYKVNMGDWHTGTGEDDFGCEHDVCQVCFAGSVMAQSLKCASNQNVGPDDFDYDTEQMLYALDNFRQGQIGEGFDTLGLNMPFGLASNVEVERYEDNPKGFKKDMRKLARTLEKFGL